VCSGSLVFSVAVSPVFSLRISVAPFFISMVKVGAKPMKEYCASFFGPSMDSRR